MSLSSSTLSAIQKVGAAAFSADEKLKKEVQAYADRVNAAISKNAYNLGNDVLIENWKVVARLSQTLVGIEEELKKVFQVASELTDLGEPSVREVSALPAPVQSASKVKKAVAASVTAKAPAKKMSAKSVSPAIAVPKSAAKKNVASQLDLTPTDVMAKPKKKAAASKAKVNKIKAAGASDKTRTLGGNSAKLLAYFERTLNTTDFSAVSQTVAAQETGIPLGSMTAAIKKLTELGRITANPVGSLQLVAAQPALQPALPSTLVA